MIFQSTLPAGEATKDEARQAADKMISIHASRGGSDKIPYAYITVDEISIHASRGGSDVR